MMVSTPRQASLHHVALSAKMSGLAIASVATSLCLPVAHHGAHAAAALGKRPQHLPSDKAGRAGEQDQQERPSGILVRHVGDRRAAI